MGKPFPIPPGIVFVKVDTRTGLLATQYSEKTRLECFLEGTEPRDFAEDEWEKDEMDFFKEDYNPYSSSPLPNHANDAKN